MQYQVSRWEYIAEHKDYAWRLLRVFNTMQDAQDYVNNVSMFGRFKIAKNGITVKENEK